MSGKIINKLLILWITNFMETHVAESIKNKFAFLGVHYVILIKY